VIAYGEDVNHSSAPTGHEAGLVALDVDGTMIDFDGNMTHGVRDTVAKVVDAGVHVVVATGRSLTATFPILEELNLDTGYIVCSNGAVTVRLDPGLPAGNEVVETITFDPSPALRLLREHLPGAAYAVEDTTGAGYRISGPFPEGELIGELRFVDFEDLLGEPATRVVVRSPSHTPQEFLELTQHIGLHGVNYAVGWTAWLDLAPEGVSKATGLELVRQRLDIPAAATVAVGDGRNDLEMFAWAGWSVAMGNGQPEAIEAADDVTRHVHEDGLVDVLESVLAGQRHL
jgi:hydroxymethylpyrimidine pyrophosphatase-like HAD family hydrolase